MSIPWSRMAGSSAVSSFSRTTAFCAANRSREAGTLISVPQKSGIGAAIVVVGGGAPAYVTSIPPGRRRGGA